jgi:hypothetical protein
MAQKNAIIIGADPTGLPSAQKLLKHTKIYPISVAIYAKCRIGKVTSSAQHSPHAFFVLFFALFGLQLDVVFPPYTLI